jgi:hypothetical protein
MDPDEGFQIMEDFVLRLPDGKAREKLAHALQMRKPFRRFKKALQEFPPIEDEWFEFHAQRLREKARDWLDSLGIEYKLV